jgi:large subunit ribosomal protein L29
MNIEDIRSKTDSELDFDLKRMKKELFGLRIKAAAETLANSAQIRDLRRSIARVNTVLHERATEVRGQTSL